MDLLETKKKFLEIVSKKLRELKYTDIAKEIKIDPEEVYGEGDLESKINHLKKYFENLHIHSKRIIKMNNFSVDYVNKFNISSSNIIVNFHSKSHSQYTLKDVNEILEKIITNPETILELINLLSERMKR